jgi:hypothetical protein
VTFARDRPEAPTVALRRPPSRVSRRGRGRWQTDAVRETTQGSDLGARVRVLEAENARLSALAVPRRSRGRWRAVVSAMLIVLAAVLVPVSIVAFWARLQLIDEDAFSRTLGPLTDNPAVQTLIVDETMAAVRERVDFDELVARVAELGLGERAHPCPGRPCRPDGVRTGW